MHEYTVKIRVFAGMFKFNTPACYMLVTIETYTKIKGFHGNHGTTPRGVVNLNISTNTVSYTHLTLPTIYAV